LRGAYLQYANLRGAYLQYANLRGAYLQYANLQDANLQDADLPHFQIVPEEGDFVAWKKVAQGVILKLQVTGKRTSSLVGRKCRCSEVFVLEALNVPEGHSGIFKSSHDATFTYEVGKTVTCPDYDDDIRVECTSGIHFFMTCKEAVEY